MKLAEVITKLSESENPYHKMGARLFQMAYENMDEIDKEDFDDADDSENEIMSDAMDYIKEIQELNNTVLLGVLEYITGIEVWNYKGENENV